VRPADAGVDDVGVHAGAGGRVRVGGVQRQIALADPIEPPGWVALGDKGFDDRILFNEGDPGIAICRAASDAARSKS
jgi:hypothetical protein